MDAPALEEMGKPYLILEWIRYVIVCLVVLCYFLNEYKGFLC